MRPFRVYLRWARMKLNRLRCSREYYWEPCAFYVAPDSPGGERIIVHPRRMAELRARLDQRGGQFHLNSVPIHESVHAERLQWRWVRRF